MQNAKSAIKLCTTALMIMASGCTGNTQGVITQAEVDGPWLGTLPFKMSDGSVFMRPVALQLQQRQNGTLLGYVLGGTEFRTVEGGSLEKDQMKLTINWSDAKSQGSVSVTGTVDGGLFTGTVDPQPGQNDPAIEVSFHRLSGNYDEKRFYIGTDSEITPDSNLLEVSVLLHNDQFVAGSFAATKDCTLFACGGGVVSFAEANGSWVVDLESKGSCMGTATFRASWNPTSNQYDHVTVDFIKQGADPLCTQTVSGMSLPIAVRGIRTTSDDVSEALGNFATLADDLEAHKDFQKHPEYRLISTKYLHDGINRDGLLANLSDMDQAWSELKVTFNQFRNLSTVDDPTIYADFAKPGTVSYHDYRAGTADGATQVLRDVAVGPGMDKDDEFVYLHSENDGLVFYGNQSAN